MSSFWSGWIIVITLVNILGCLWLLWWTRKKSDDTIADGESMGHSFDGIEELNTPLPRWWLQLFYITIAFAFIYLLLYPGFGRFAGLLGWTSSGQWEMEVERADNQFNRIFRDFAAVPVEGLVNNPDAMQAGERLFGTNCAICHGSDAKGSPGFPNLTDKDWLYGGSPDAIQTTLTNGRRGMMPPMAAALGNEQGVKDVAAYVLSLSGLQGSGDAEAGKARFMVCAACHGMEGKGNPAMGAPNLTDDVWLYGNSEADVIQAITQGRNGVMPAFGEQLSPERIHVLTAYIYSLSQ